MNVIGLNGFKVESRKRSAFSFYVHIIELSAIICTQKIN